MTPLAPHSDQAVRHAVDAYVDGRLLPTFEGEASFETRNSTYRVLDGVLYVAPDHGLLGAELVGWLVEFVTRAEVSQAWRPGARAILVDTRNDGVKGPHIIVTSATRGFRKERVPSAPSLPAAGSRVTQDGHAMPHRWGQRDVQQSLPRDVQQSLPRDVQQSLPRDVQQSLPRDVHHAPLPRHDLPALPPIPAAPGSPSWGLLPPPAPPRMPSTLPPPAVPMHFPRVDAIPPPARVPMITRSTTLPPPPPPRLLPRALPPPAHEDDFIARRIAATLDAAVTAADDLDDAAPTARAVSDVRNGYPEDFQPSPSRGRSMSRLSHGASVGGSSRDHGAGRSAPAPLPPASVPFLLSRSHQRGVPLR